MARTSPGEFIRQVRAETAKVHWPTRKETIATAIMVMIMTVLVNGGFGVEKIVSHFLMDQIKTFKGYKLLQRPGD